MTYPKNRGNTLFGFLIAFAIGGLIGAGIACLAGWICGHSGGGGGGGGSVTIGQNQCNSSPNACGLVSIGNCTGGSGNSGGGSGGSCVCDAVPPPNSQCPSCSSPPNACGQTNAGTQDNSGTCSATTPSNAGCPTPVIPPDNGFTANPTILTTTVANPSGQTTLTWQSTNSTDCSIVGDNGFSASGGSSGSTVASLNTTTTFTLTCQDGPGGPTASRSLRVIVNAHYIEK